MNKTQFALLISCIGLAASAHGMKTDAPELDAIREQLQEEQDRMVAVYTRSDIATIEDRTQPLAKRLEALADLHTMFRYNMLPTSYVSVIQKYDDMLQQEQSVLRTAASASSAK